MNNEVLSMSSDTKATDPVADAHANQPGNNCGRPAITLTLPIDSGKRADGRKLMVALKEKNYGAASNAAEFNAIDVSRTEHLIGLFLPSPMRYDLDRNADQEPSLAEMTAKAMEVLAKNSKGYFLMVAGARIDHAPAANRAGPA